MNFNEETTNLARAIARVLADGPGQKRLRGVEPPVAMVARDTVVGELRTMSRVLRGDADRRLQATDPIHRGIMRMHNALAALPRACPGGLSLSDALAVQGGTYCRRWQEAARAALQLEMYHDVLEGPQARGATLRLAQLAATVEHLDTDLARTLPGGPTTRAVFDQPAHRQLSRACEAVTSQLSGSAIEEVASRPFIPRVLPVRSIKAVPAAMRHLAKLIERRGENITAHEIRAVTRALLAGIELAAHESPALAKATKPLGTMLTMPLATMTAPSPRLLNLAAEVRGTIGKQDGKADEVFALGWTASAAVCSDALMNTLARAGAAGHLLRPATGIPDDDGQRLLWIRVSPAQVSGLTDLIAPALRILQSEQACSTRAQAQWTKPTQDRDRRP